MTNKPETVNREDLIGRWDGLYYKKKAKVPFTGTSEQFHTNGQLKHRQNYKNGQRMFRGYDKNWKGDGLWEYFDKEGNLTQTETYKKTCFQNAVSFIKNIHSNIHSKV